LGYVKPDITFFGESLPKDFVHCIMRDFPKCDCLIVLGTSLQVQPFASLIDRVPNDCPRLLINREQVIRNVSQRDVFLQGDCDSGIETILNMMELPRKQSVSDDVGTNLLNDIKSIRKIIFFRVITNKKYFFFNIHFF
jgi:NAD-dependent SIR2 family protein deacetylase